MTATITVLAEKGSPLSHTEMDNNFRALRNLVEPSTVAALRALGDGAIPAGNGTCITQGCLAAGDGGGGVWQWDSTVLAATPDNIGTIVRPTGHAGDGAWVRVFSGALSVKWFGCAADGVTDDTPAFTAALAAGDHVHVPEGTYAIKDLYVAGSKLLQGSGMETTTLKAAGACTHAVVYAGQPFTRISHLSIDGNKANYTVTGFKTSGSLYANANFCIVLDSVLIKNCKVYGCHVDTANAFTIKDSSIWTCDDTSLYLHNARKYLVDNCDIEQSTASAIVVDATSYAETGGTISNNWFETITGVPVIVLNAYNQLVIGNKFNAAAATYYIQCGANASHVQINANNFQNAAATKNIIIDSGALHVKIGWNRGVGFASATTLFGVTDSGTNTVIDGNVADTNVFSTKAGVVSLNGWSFSSTDLTGSAGELKNSSGSWLLQANTRLLLRSGSAGGNYNIEIGALNGVSTYEKGHIVLGAYHIWVDGSGVLRIKNGAPTSATDGTVVGAQT